MFANILYKTSNGIPLDQKEIKLLKCYLGYTPSLGSIVFLMLFLVLEIYLSMLFLGVFSFFPKLTGLLTINIILFLAVLSIVIIYYRKNRKDYYNELKYYLSKKINDYEDYNKEYTYIYALNNMIDEKLISKNIIFLTNGYNFIIFNDFFLALNCVLGRSYREKYNDKPRVKIINSKTNDLEPIKFGLKDVEYFHLYSKNKIFKDKGQSPLTKIYLEKKDYIEIGLVSGEIFQLGPSVYNLLQEYVPFKERIDD